MQLKLEEADKSGAVSLEEAIARRESRRAFKRTKLTRKQVSQLLWAAGKAPSAGATYPLDLYVVIGQDCVEAIPRFLLPYEPSALLWVALYRGYLSPYIPPEAIYQQ